MKERVRAALRERGTAPVHASQLEWEAKDNKGLMKYHKVPKIYRMTEKREKSVCLIEAI